MARNTDTLQEAKHRLERLCRCETDAIVPAHAQAEALIIIAQILVAIEKKLGTN